MYCSHCGSQIKDKAKFCHACGKPTGTEVKQKASPQNVNPKQSWLNSFGYFLLIPVFAVIIVLLFWANREPGPLNEQQSNNAPQNDAPGMAAMGQVHETLERLKKRIGENPKDLVAIDSLAVMFSIAGSHEKAKSLYEKHLEIDPDNNEIKISLGLAYHNLQQTDKAIAIIQGVLDKEPTNAFGLHYLAEIYASMHEHDKATGYWQQIIAHYPGTEIAKVAEKRLKEQTEN